MIPFKSIKIGCFTYKIVYADVKVSDTHGQTCTSNKEILIYKDDNEEVIRETLQHEIMHALMEDITDVIKDMDEAEKLEETFIRLFSPRLMMVMTENPKLVKYLWNQKK
jgi:hypothetical protein